MSMETSGNPLAIRSKGAGGRVSLCLPLAHGLGFCGTLMLALGAPYCALNIFWPSRCQKVLVPMCMWNHTTDVRSCRS
jgi:hypothetical protein